MFDEPQIGLPGSHNPLNRIAQESGLVHSLEPITAGLMIGGTILSGIMGHASQAEQDRKQEQRRADAHAHYNKYAKKQDKFNKKLWQYDKQKLKQNYKYLKEEASIRRQNESANAEYADSVNTQKWAYDLMIRNSEQIALNQQYAKSNKLYVEQLDVNAETAHRAASKEYNRLEEAEVKHAFDSQELELQTLLKYETIKSKGRQGKSVLKSQQAVMAQRGRSAAVLIESLTSSGRDISATLEDIAADQNNADIQAFAQKMLKPGSIPIRPIPPRTPVPVIQDPKKPNKYDYGPKPMKVFKKEDLHKKHKKAAEKFRKKIKNAAAGGLLGSGISIF